MSSSINAVISDKQAPALELDGEMLSESGYIITRLQELAQKTSSQISSESETSHDSQYHAHYAEGTVMLWKQSATLVWLTTRSTAYLQTGEEGHKAVQDYAEWVSVSQTWEIMAESLGECLAARISEAS